MSAPDLRNTILVGNGDAASRLHELHKRVDTELPNHTWLTGELHHIRQIIQGTINDALAHGPDADHDPTTGALSEGPGGVKVTHAPRPKPAKPTGRVQVHKAATPRKPSAKKAGATRKAVVK